MGGCSTSKSLKLVFRTILRRYCKILWKVCVFILSRRYEIKKSKNPAFGRAWRGVRKSGQTPPPHWYGGSRPHCKFSKNLQLVVNLGRMSERDLKFHLNPNWPNCSSSMASQWRNCDFIILMTSSKFVRTFIIHIFPIKRHLMMIDPSFFMFRHALFKKTQFDNCCHQKMCLCQHFRSSELLMTSSWRHVTSSCRMSDFLVLNRSSSQYLTSLQVWSSMDEF